VTQLKSVPLRLLTVAYAPRPEERSFLSRAVTATRDGLTVETVALSAHESQRIFGVRMAHRGIQPLWIRIVNGTDRPHRLDLLSVDPSYYTPLEAAYVNHFAVGKRLLSFGLLAWLYLPLLPLVPFKLVGARRANRRMNQLFKSQGYPPGPIQPGAEKTGFVFVRVDEGVKDVDLKIVAQEKSVDFSFSLEVPGLTLEGDDEDAATRGALQELDEPALRALLKGQPPCTSNQLGTRHGDPLNLVVVGDRSTILQSFGAHWDEVESITFATSLKTFRAFLLDSEYRYSPVSPLYLAGRRQELALQKARASINERIHLRLWRTGTSFNDQPVWIGQCSRDIGVRSTLKTWNLTTHKIDPDVDEARDYVIDDLVAAGRAARIGYVTGVGVAPPSEPRRNLTGDPYFTDGLRAVVVLSKNRVDAKYFNWM